MAIHYWSQQLFALFGNLSNLVFTSVAFALLASHFRSITLQCSSAARSSFSNEDWVDSRKKSRSKFSNEDIAGEVDRWDNQRRWVMNFTVEAHRVCSAFYPFRLVGLSALERGTY
jgi:hypothetical protein